MLRAVILMLDAFLTQGCGAGSGEPARLSQECPPLRGMAWRGKQELRLQPHPCPCPAMAPHVTPLGVTFLLPGGGAGVC